MFCPALTELGRDLDDIRLAGAAITLWILRCAQNDAYCYDYSTCKSAILRSLDGFGGFGAEAGPFHQVADGDQAGGHDDQDVHRIHIREDGGLLHHHFVNARGGMAGGIGSGKSSIL